MMDQFSAAGAVVLGASVDSETSHKRFAEKYSLTYPLLSDVRGKLSAAMGVLQKVGPVKLSARVTFVINEEGKVAKVFDRVSPRSHAQAVLTSLQ
jgi:peroxiredoxin Q/BCP